MRVLVPGHRYALRNLKGGGETVLQFFQDPDLHGGVGCAGPSCQEVIRALIDRVQCLDGEKRWAGNDAIVALAREMIALFEMRALLNRTRKGLPIERLAVCDGGHLLFASADEHASADARKPLA